MKSETIYLLVGATVWLLGLQGLLLVHHIMRRIIAVNLMSTGVFLVMVALAARRSPADPVLQALVLTGIVVAISATAFAIRLASAQAQHGTERPISERHHENPKGNERADSEADT